MMQIRSLLKVMMDKNASDLHLRAGIPPTFRVEGNLLRAQMEPLAPADMENVVTEMMNEDQRAQFRKSFELDFAVGIKGVGRFRVNAFRQRGTPALAIRSIKSQVPHFGELGFPDVVLDVAMRKRGLVLVTGTTGSGKSTLLAAMVDHINESTALNVVTIEDPIEFLHRNKKSIIAQREIGPDSHSFFNSLRASLRQDPDVILIGEIRDTDTMETALTASDTGHLVMSTLHTMNAAETISRIVSFFPPHQHQQVRLILSNVLVSIISLRLLPRKDGTGRIPATEILINNANIAEYLLEPAKHHLIMDAVAEGYTQYGSQTFDQSLLQLYRDDLISFTTAKRFASNPEDFELKIRGVEGASDRHWIE